MANTGNFNGTQFERKDTIDIAGCVIKKSLDTQNYLYPTFPNDFKPSQTPSKIPHEIITDKKKQIYIDVSKLPLLRMQFYIVFEMVGLLVMSGMSIIVVQPYWSYPLTLGHVTLLAMLSAPLSLLLAAGLEFRTIWSIFSLNFILKSSKDSIKFIVAVVITRLFLSIIIFLIGLVLFTQMQSLEEITRSNLRHIIHYSSVNARYAKEIHRMQHNIMCCGVNINMELINSTLVPMRSPWNAWFRNHLLDESYSDQIRSLYTLPWSCCVMLSERPCEHLGFSRYLVSQSTPYHFHLAELKYNVNSWNPATFESASNRTYFATSTVFKKDCAEALTERLIKDGVVLAKGLFIAGGIMLLSTIFLNFLVNTTKKLTSQETSNPINGTTVVASPTLNQILH